MTDAERLQALKDERERRQLASPPVQPQAGTGGDDRQARLIALMEERERRSAATPPVPDPVPAPDIPRGDNEPSFIMNLLSGPGTRTAADVDPQRFGTADEPADVDMGMIGTALPILLGGLGAVGGAIAGPVGMAGGGAAGAAGGQALVDMIETGDVDIMSALAAGLFGAIPGVGGAASKAVAPAARVAKEFLPDAAGALVGGSVGGSFYPGLGAVAGAKLGARHAANQFGRGRGAMSRYRKAVKGQPKGSKPTAPGDRGIPGNAERQRELRRELLGFDG